MNIGTTSYLVIGFTTVLATIIGLILVCIFSFEMSNWLRHRGPFTGKMGWVVPTACILAGAVLVSPLLLVEFVSKKRVVISQRGTVVRCFPENCILWQWDWNKLIAGNYLTSYESRTVGVAISAHPITENPKVRSFRYVVTAKTREIPDEFALFEKEIGVRSCVFAGDLVTSSQESALSRKVQSLLYEFNESNSKELAKLYNPLNNDQQDHFRNLVIEFFREPLNKIGAEVSKARFDIGD